MHSFRHWPHVNPCCPCLPSPQIRLRSVSGLVITIPENQELSYFSQELKKKKRALWILAASKINHFPAPLHWPNLQGWTAALPSQPRTLNSALHTNLKFWCSVRILPIISAVLLEMDESAKVCQNARSIKWCLPDFELWGLLDLPHLPDWVPLSVHTHPYTLPILLPLGVFPTPINFSTINSLNADTISG